MKMNLRDHNFEQDLRTSVGLVCGLLLAVGFVVVLISWVPVLVERQLRLLYAALPFLFVAVVAWILESCVEHLARPFIIVALNLGVGLLGWALQMPELLVALAVVTALAAALLGVPVAAVNAAAETLALIVLARWLPPSTFVPVTILLIWTLWGVMVIVYHPVDQLGAWLWRYFQHARQLTLQAREDRMQFAQSLEDYKHASRQLALAGERATALRQAAEEAQRAKAQFVSRVSHELRAPLNIIIGLVGLMVENPALYAEELPPELHRDLNIVHRNCRYLTNLVNDVLDLSRTEAGRMRLHPELASMADIVESTLDIVRPLADKKGLRLRADLPDDLPRVYCDPVRIRQVILNLVSNAVRFTEAGSVSVSVTVDSHRLVVRVSDTGPGIPPEDVERIFEPFYQTDQRREHTGASSGLGLSISKALIQRHGGRIWLASEFGRGTSFFFDLPLAPAQLPRARAGHKIVADWVWRERAFRTDRTVRAEELVRPRWLVVDETGGLRTHLARYTDVVEFVETASVAEAAEELARYAAHGLLLNAATPGNLLDGVQQAREKIAEVPIIGCDIAPPLQSVQEMGAQGYLVKPVTGQDLETVFEAVERPVRRVLVADDEAESVRVLAETLRARDPALEIVTAHDGDEVLTTARQHPPDVFLLDVVMPQMDGWQTLRAIRGSDALAETPVFFVSAQNPESAPPRSAWLLATTADGISVEDVVFSALDLSARLTGRTPTPDPARRETPDTESASEGTDRPRGRPPGRPPVQSSTE